MEVRFGRNDYLETKEIATSSDMGYFASIQDLDELRGIGPMGDSQSIEKLLLFTLLDQATKMSSPEDEATFTRLTGSNRQVVIDAINEKIATFGK